MVTDSTLETSVEPARRAGHELRVRDCMTPNPITIEEDMRAARALELMERHTIKHVLVTRDGALSGLLSERHLRDAMPSILTLRDPRARRKNLEITSVRDIAIQDPETVSPDTRLVDAIGQLRRLRAGSLPVVDGGRLVGILTAGDLVTLLEEILQAAPGGVGE